MEHCGIDVTESTEPTFDDVFAYLKDKHKIHTDVLILSGSHSYGLAHAGSDIDVRGIYYTHSNEFLTIRNGKTSIRSDGIYDYTAHEFNEFIRLMTTCNPNMLELAFLLADPDAHVVTRSNYQDLVGFIVEVLPLCLSSDGVRKAYGGFATGQMKRMDRHEEDDPRRAKLIRHGFRVLDQGIQLLEGKIPVVKLEGEAKEELLKFEKMEADMVAEKFRNELAYLDNMPSEIQAEPNLGLLNTKLINFRTNKDFR